MNSNIEKVVEYWDKRPCNIYHSDKEIGSKEYFDEVEKKKYFVEPHILSFVNFPEWNKKKVLEIGCGIGTAAIGFIRNGAKYTGIDISKKSVDIAKQRLEVYNVSGDILVCNAEIDLPTDKYDLVYSFGVIHHSPNPKKIIENISKIMNSGAELRIMLYSKWSYKLFWILHTYDEIEWKFDKNMDESIAKYSEAQTGCPIAFTYTFDEIKSLLQPYFKIENIWKDHIFPYDIEKYKNHEYVKSEEFINMNEKEFKSMEKELGWHTLVKAVRV